MAKKNVKAVVDKESTETFKEWLAAKTALEAAQKTEKMLRDTLVSLELPSATEGTHNLEFDGVGSLAVQVVLNRTVEQGQFEAAMQYAKNRGNNYLLTLLQTAFRSKVEVAVGGYKQLSSEDKRALGDIVTEKVGSPQFKITSIVGGGDVADQPL